MANARRLSFAGGAMFVVTLVCLTFAGWTIYQSFRGPRRVQVDPNFQLSTNSPWGRIRKQQEKHAVPEPAYHDPN
jgi:hypothetical protein